MEIECSSERLKTVASVMKSGRRNPMIPMYGYMFIEAANGKAMAVGMSGDAKIVCDLLATVKKDGKVELPVRQLYNFLRKGDRIITISTDEKKEKRVVVSERSDGYGKMILYQPDFGGGIDVPKCDVIAIQLDSEFTRKLGRATIAAAREESRPVLAGVKMEFTKQKLDLVSADGFRLLRISMPTNVSVERDIILPLEPCHQIARYMGQDVTARLGENEIWFESNGLTIITQRVQGTYPQYTSVIPPLGYVWKFTMSAPVLQEQMTRFEPGAGIVRLTTEDGFLKIAMGDEEYGTFEAKVPATIEGEGAGDPTQTRIAVNKNYIRDFASLFAEITCEMTTPSSPLKVYGDLEDTLGVLMPMFVQW